MLEELKETIEKGNDDVKELTSLEVKRTKLIIAEACTELTVKAMTFVVSFFFIGTILFFLSMGAALLLDGILNVPGAGFFIIAALFIMALSLFFAFRKKWLESPIVRMFIKILFRDKTEEKI
ncbi:MAG: hypothetical protein MJZ33_09365 [Paludibacteraceae bacterium]|nr:hypothetical protein [Paludibacteraceae bacterium]